MGFYRKFVVPHLVNFAMNNRDAARCRSEILPQAHDRVVEIGIGSGFNLPFYSDRVTKVSGVDPSRELLEMARQKTNSVMFPVDLIKGSAEELPLESNSADTVVMTWTLCSIPDPARALTEVRRVLKSSGELIFVEHGLAPEPNIRRWQNRINRPWKAATGGCNLNRAIDQLISSAGLRIQRLDTSYLPGPRMFTFTYKGSARKQ